MLNPFFRKLTTNASPILKKGKNWYGAVKKMVITQLSELKKVTTPNKKGKSSLSELISLICERWKFFTLALSGFLILYYGLGAAVSSKIDNALNHEILIKKNARYSTAALIHVLKKQIDDTPWTPALPIIFPASILDNLPNFQIGAKDSVKYFVKKMSAFHTDKNLKNTVELLNYPHHIWLFSQTDNDKLAPGSAKQYRKAIKELTNYAKTETENSTLSAKELLYFLNSSSALLETIISQLSKHVQEHSGELLDLKADNIFFYSQGEIYTLYYFLTSLAKDYQHLIVESGQYENLTAALKYLQDAEDLAPISVKNAIPKDIYEANHLLYLAFYLSRAQNRIIALSSNLVEFLK